MKRISFLQPMTELTPELVSLALTLVSLDIQPDEMGSWSEIDLLVVYDWAARETLAASDNNVRRRPRPGLLACARPFKLEVPRIQWKRQSGEGVSGA